MKLDPKTIQVLKNFATINPSLNFKEGNVLRTLSASRNVMGKVTLDQSFDKEFNIYELPRFLSVISLFDEPDLQLNERFVTIQQDKRKVNYTYADPSTMIKIPDQEIHLPSVDATVTLTRANLDDALKALSVLRLPQLAFVADGNTVSIQAVNVADPSSDVYSIDLGDTDATFKAVISADNIKVIPGDYEIDISSAGITHFKGVDVEYWIALEDTSKF